MDFNASNNNDIELSIFNDDIPRNLIIHRDTGGIGIKCNGRVIVKTAKMWHESAAVAAALAPVPRFKFIRDHLGDPGMALYECLACGNSTWREKGKE